MKGVQLVSWCSRVQPDHSGPVHPAGGARPGVARPLPQVPPLHGAPGRATDVLPQGRQALLQTRLHQVRTSACLMPGQVRSWYVMYVKSGQVKAFDVKSGQVKSEQSETRP